MYPTWQTMNIQLNNRLFQSKKLDITPFLSLINVVTAPISWCTTLHSSPRLLYNPQPPPTPTGPSLPDNYCIKSRISP